MAPKRSSKKMPVVINMKTGKISTKKKSTAAKPTQTDITALGQAMRLLGGAGGGALGSYFGAQGIGSSIGTGLGALISRWSGNGDYSVRSNSVLRMADSVPDMHKSGQSVVIRHKEFILTVKNQTNDYFSALQINPGNPAMFPWLSKMAMGFEQYRIKGMVFHYIPTSGAVSTSQALGWVALQTTYRSGTTRPGTKQEMLNEYNANESVPSQAFIHPVECNPSENPFTIKYCNNKPLTSDANGVDALMYNHGDLFIGNGGQPVGTGDGTVALGDLWVTYEIELLKPVVKSDRTITLMGSCLSGAVSTPTLNNWFTQSNLYISNLFWGVQGRTLTIPASWAGTAFIHVQVAGAASSYFFGPVNSGIGATATNCTTSPIDTQGNARWSTTTAIITGSDTVRQIHYAIRIDKAVTATDATVVFPLFTVGSGTVDSVNMNVYAYETQVTY